MIHFIHDWFYENDLGVGHDVRGYTELESSKFGMGRSCKLGGASYRLNMAILSHFVRRKTKPKNSHTIESNPRLQRAHHLMVLRSYLLGCIYYVEMGP